LCFRSLDKSGRGAIDALAGPKLSGKLSSGELKRGHLDVAEAAMALTIPSVRTLRLEQRKQPVSSERSGISSAMITAALKQLPPNSLVVLSFDETDIAKRLETDHRGNWFGDVDFGGLEIDHTPFLVVRKEYEGKMQVLNEALSILDRVMQSQPSVARFASCIGTCAALKCLLPFL
jgi:hypothetical protein